MIKILIVQIIDIPNTIFKRNNAVEDIKSHIKFFVGFLLLAQLLHDISLLVVSSGSFGSMICIKIEYLEGLIKQRASKVSHFGRRILGSELTAR